MKLYTLQVCEMKSLIHYQTAMVQAMKFGNKQVNFSHALLGMLLLIPAGIKVKLCQ